MKIIDSGNVCELGSINHPCEELKLPAVAFVIDDDGVTFAACEFHRDFALDAGWTLSTRIWRLE